MDYSKSKFDSPEAERLYSEIPDSDIGSVDELGWAGRYDREKVILINDSTGFVWTDQFDNQEELDDAWDEILMAYEDFDKGLLV